MEEQWASFNFILFVVASRYNRISITSIFFFVSEFINFLLCIVDRTDAGVYKCLFKQQESGSVIGVVIFNVTGKKNS